MYLTGKERFPERRISSIFFCKLVLWEQSIQNKAEILTWLELDSYLTERHRILEAVDGFRSANFLHVQSKDTNRVAEFPKINSFNTRLVPIPKGCDLCSKKNHPVRICPRFLQMTVDDGRLIPGGSVERAVLSRCLSLNISPLSLRSALERLS